MPPLTLYLIRHGETAWSLSGQHTGRTDLALTPTGETMALGLAAALEDTVFSQVLTSPLLRARLTCALAGLGSAARIEPELAEWNYGDYEGLRSSEIRQMVSQWEVWEHGCPNGESPADISARADRLIARLLHQRGNIALFSHGHFGRALAMRWIGLPICHGRHFALDPGSISMLGSERSHPEQRVISLWNAQAAGSIAST